MIPPSRSELVDWTSSGEHAWGHLAPGATDKALFPEPQPALFQDTLSEKPPTERRQTGAGWKDLITFCFDAMPRDER
jgi:hypothetical protein